MAESTKASDSGECNGVKFYMNSRWEFYVPDLDKSYDSHQQMSDAIERSKKAIDAQKKVKLNLPVLTKKGEEIVITGIHAGHGHVITNPKVKHDCDRVTPVVDWIRDARKERNRLRALQCQLDEVIEKFQFDPTAKSWNRAFDGTPEGLAALHAKKLKAAEATNLKEQLAKTPVPKETEFD